MEITAALGFRSGIDRVWSSRFAPILYAKVTPNELNLILEESYFGFFTPFDTLLQFRNKSSAFSRHQNSNTKILDYLTPFEEYQVKTYNSSELKDLAESIPFQAAIKNLGRLFESNEIELMFTNGTNIPMIGPVKKSSMRSQELMLAQTKLMNGPDFLIARGQNQYSHHEFSLFRELQN